MTDRLGEMRQQLAESVARLAELEAAAIDAMLEAKPERDISAIEMRKAQARDRVLLLQKTIRQLEHQIQLDAQAFMMRETMAFVGPLIAPLDEATAKLALPPYTKPMQPLEPEVVPAKKIGRWFGNPKQGGNRWNERAR
jgi:hypothetical protein